MRRLRPVCFLLALLVWTGTPRAARAGDGSDSITEEERQEAIELNTDRGWAAFRSGNHEEVLARMKRLRKYDPGNPLADYLTARVYVRTGRYEKALDTTAAALAKHPAHRGLETARFRALDALGRTDESITAARAILARHADDIVAHTWLGVALEERGRREDALAQYDKVVALYNGGTPAPEELPCVARAAVRATWLSPNPADDMIPAALRLLDRYLRKHPDDLDAKLQLAEVYQSDRGARSQSLARKFYGQVLKENSEVAAARVGLARTDLMFYQQAQARRELERALETNPHLVPALALLASIHVGNGDYGRAEKRLGQALAVDPQDRKTLSIQAALHWIRGQRDDYGKLRKKVLGEDPTYGDFYLTCADLVGERQRRYDTAIEFARKAIATDPANRYAYVTLGEALMNRGQTDEALKQFKIGVEKSKHYADVRRDNWIEVLGKWMPTFKTVETKHFRIRMPLAEWPVMRWYLPPWLEQAYASLTKQYGYVVESPTYADSFNRRDDFSVRSVGSTGLPALGVCFGNTLTLLGPTSMPVGSFSWADTAWHEFTHVVTLQLSKGQVPRWLTEGLSVFAEKQRHARWARQMERQLYDRWRNGRLLKMSEINAAFRGPDILFAYYQGGLIAEQLMQQRGFEVIPKMLEAYAKDESTARVFKQVLGLDLATYDKQFSAYVGTIVGDFKMVPIWDDKSMTAFQARVKKDPKDVEALVRLGWGHLQRGREIDAGAALEKARKLAPDDPEVELLQARMAEGGGRTDIAEGLYRKFLEQGHDDLHARLFLAKRAVAEGRDTAAAVKHLEAAKACFPRYVGRDSPYLQLARLYRGAGKMEKAVAELEAFAAIAGDNYAVRKELKTWYLKQKDAKQVARVCSQMVEISPYGADVSRGKPPDLSLHRDYAAALTELGRMDEAVRERRVQVAVGRLLPEESQLEGGVVQDYLELGNLLLDRGDASGALDAALGALRLSPRDAGARMLKRRAQEAVGPR